MYDYGASDTISDKRNIPLADEGERNGVWEKNKQTNRIK